MNFNIGLFQSSQLDGDKILEKYKVKKFINVKIEENKLFSNEENTGVIMFCDCVSIQN